MAHRGQWCWTETQYVCQDSADSYMLTEAMADFSKTKREYVEGGGGQDADSKRLYEADTPLEKSSFWPSVGFCHPCRNFAHDHPYLVVPGSNVYPRSILPMGILKKMPL